MVGPGDRVELVAVAGQCADRQTTVFDPRKQFATRGLAVEQRGKVDVRGARPGAGGELDSVELEVSRDVEHRVE